MKLHLPYSLRTALLTCLTALSLPVTIGTGALSALYMAQSATAATLTPETTGYNGNRYSGKIYTISGSTTFHESTFTQLKEVDGAEPGEYEGINGQDRVNDNGDSTPSYAFWQNVWCEGMATAGVGSRYGQTLRFAGAEDDITYDFQFAPLYLGGIITESGNNGTYTLHGNGSIRRIDLISSSRTVYFTLQSNLEISNNCKETQDAIFHSDTLWEIGAGKTLSWSNYNVVTDDWVNIEAVRMGGGSDVSYVTLDRNLTLGRGSRFTVGSGIDFTVEGSLQTEGAVRLFGGNLTLNGEQHSVSVLEIRNGSTLSLPQGSVLELQESAHLEEGSNITCGSLILNGNESIFNNDGSIICDALILNGKGSVFHSYGPITYNMSGETNNLTIVLNEGTTFSTTRNIAYREVLESDSTLNVDVTVGKGATFEASRIAYVAADLESCVTVNGKITVDEGATFSATSIAIIFGLDCTLSADITVNEGATFSVSTIAYGGNGYGRNSETVSANITVNSRAIFNTDGYIAYAGQRNSTVSADITVNEGASFNIGGYSIIGYGLTGSTTSVNLEVSGLYDMSQAEEGRFAALGNQNGYGGNMSVDIVVHEGGTFLLGDSESQASCVIAYQLGSYESPTMDSTISASIVVDGTFTMDYTGNIAYYDHVTGYGDVEVKEKLSVDIIVNGEFTINAGTIARASGITYDVDLEQYDSSVSANIKVNSGGVFNMNSGIIGSMEASSLPVFVSLTVDGTFTMNGGYIAYSNLYSHLFEYLFNSPVCSAANADICVNKGGRFIMNDGRIATTYYLTADADITVEGAFEMNGGQIAEQTGEGAVARAVIRVQGDGQFTYTGGSFGEGAEMIISDAGVLDMSGKEMAVRATMAGGELRNASEFAGELSLVSGEGYRGELKLGGVNAARVKHVQTGSGVRVSGWHGALTIHEGDYMYVGAEHVGAFGEAKEALLSFAGSGSVVFEDSITLYFEDEALAGLVNGVDGKPEFEIYFTNGTLNVLDIDKIVLGNDAGWEIAAIEDGRLMINGKLPEIWYASENVSAEDGKLLAGKRMPLTSQKKVVVDRDANLSISTNMQMNYLQGDSNLTLSGKGNVALLYTQGETEYAGNIRSGADVALEKKDAGDMKMVGELHAEGAVRVSEGKMTLSGAANSIRNLAALEGELRVDGALELGGGNLSEASGSITGGGSLTLTGDLTLGGQVRVAVSELNAEAVKLDIMGKSEVTMSSGYISNGSEITVSEEAVLRYKGGTLGSVVSLVVSEQGTLDLTGQKLARNLTICGGRLMNAEQYAGTALVNVDDAFSGVIDFGGMDAARVRVSKAGREVNFSGLKEGSKLTLDKSISLRVGAEHITLGHEHVAQQAMVSFLGSGGTVNVADATITLEFDAETLFAQSRSSEDARLEIWFTNGALMAKPESFSFSGGWDMWVDDLSIDAMENGRLVIHASLDDVWFAADHVGDDGEVGNEMPQGFHGKVVVNKDTHLALSGDVQFNYLEGTHNLTLDGKGDVTLHNKQEDTVYEGDIAITSGSLIKTGAGAFTMAGDLTADKVVVQEGDFTIAYGSHSVIGELAGRAIVQGSLELLNSSPEADIVNKMYVSLQGSAQGEMQLKNLDTQSGAMLLLQAGSADATAQAGAGLHVTENAVFRTMSTTILLLNLNSESLWKEGSAMSLTADGQITIERGAKFVINALQDNFDPTKNLVNVTVMSGQAVQLVDQPTEDAPMLARLALVNDMLDVQLEGLLYVYYGEATLMLQDNELVLNATLRSAENDDEEGDHGTGEPEIPTDPGEEDKPLTNVFAQAVSSSGTAYAGAMMLDHVDLTKDGTLLSLGDALGTMLAHGENTQAAKVMAAVAGGAVTAIGSAQRDAMREQMNRARAHAEQGYYVPQDKKLHTWIEAAASYAKVGADADESGYKLDSWGGSVGVDYAVSESLTMGLALTAMYGDLTAEAAEQAEGKLDAYYVSLWAHKQSSRWGHSFLVMASTSDASLDRTVNYGSGAYTAQGSTSGSGYGALYELTYDIPLSETRFWQPLMSISMMSTSTDAYNETGAEGAGLAVGEQEQTVTTVSLGARWVSRAGADIFGSTAVVELSGRIAQDMGDTRSEADNALLANPTYTRKVQSAEIGSTSLQLGAGLAIPTGKATQVYMNANADLRSGSTNWNVGAGIRCSF